MEEKNSKKREKQKKEAKNFSEREKLEILQFLKENMCIQSNKLDFTAWEA